MATKEGADVGKPFRDRREYIPVGFGKNILFFTIPKGLPDTSARVLSDVLDFQPAHFVASHAPP